MEILWVLVADGKGVTQHFFLKLGDANFKLNLRGKTQSSTKTCDVYIVCNRTSLSK